MIFNQVRRIAYLALAMGATAVASNANSQVVINEFVDDERTATSGQIPDTREFLELYNAGASPVDIGNWTLSSVRLNTGITVTDTIPAGTILAPNDYFVIGAAGVPNVDFTPALPGADLFPDTFEANFVFELRDASSSLIDAVATEVGRNPQLSNYADAAGLAQLGGGWWGQAFSANVSPPNSRYSLARYLDGRDANNNGRDFGILPLSPGSANNLPSVGAYRLPDVDGLPTGAVLASEYASFVLPTVIDPTVVDGANLAAIPPSPQGGKAVTAWDPAGGGNVAYSRAYVNEFALYAYVETAPLAPETFSTQSETTIYGIGTSDPFFINPDPNGILGAPSSQTLNGSTGLGWMIQRVTRPDGPTFESRTVVSLLDMNNGGNSVPSAGDWDVIQTMELTGLAAGWHRLTLRYDAVDGSVAAGFDEHTFSFTTEAELIGNFYVGYRESISGFPAAMANARPPAYDMIPEPTTGFLALLSVSALTKVRRRRICAGE